MILMKKIRYVKYIGHINDKIVSFFSHNLYSCFPISTLPLLKIVYKTDKAGGCTRFSVDIIGSGESTCLNNAPLPPHEGNDVPGRREPKDSDQSLEDIQLSSRELAPSGYRYVF